MVWWDSDVPLHEDDMDPGNEVIAQNLIELRNRLAAVIDMKWAMATSGSNICDVKLRYYKRIFVWAEVAKHVWHMARLN